jgi:hypothetical protein
MVASKREDIPTPNTNEIVVLSSFQRGFNLPTCELLKLVDN